MSVGDHQPPTLDDSVVIKLSKSARNRAIARILVIVIAGVAFGYYYRLNTQAKLQAVENLTQAEYAANFEAHKAEVKDDAIPTNLAPIIGLLAACLIYGPYELLVILLAWMMGKILRSG